MILWNYLCGTASPLLLPSASSESGLRILEYHSSSDGFLTHCRGTAINETGHTVRHATIVFKIMDQGRAVAGTATDQLSLPLAPGERWAFDAVSFRCPVGGYSDLWGIDHD